MFIKNTLQLLKPNDKSINIYENEKYMKIRKFKNKLLAFEVIRDYIYFESNKNKPSNVKTCQIQPK